MRTAATCGSQGESLEHTGPPNPFLGDTRDLALTPEDDWHDGSPVQSTGANDHLGDDGVRDRAQWQMAF